MGSCFTGVRTKVLLELTSLIFEIIRIDRAFTFAGDIWPLLSILTIDFNPFLNIAFSIRQNRFDWAFRLANTAIDALVRMDYQHIFANVKTIDWADLDAILIFAFDTVLVDDIGHMELSLKLSIYAGAALPWTDSRF